MNTQYRILVFDPDRTVGPEFIRILIDIEFSIRVAEDIAFLARVQRDFSPHMLVVIVRKSNDVGIKCLKEISRQFSQDLFARLVILESHSDALEIEAFGAGADSVLTLPLRARALKLRIQALIRRSNPDAVLNPELLLGPLKINRTTHSVVFRDEVILLGTREFDLLYFLAEYPGKVFTRAELLQRVMGMHASQNPRTIDVHICNLREKLHPDLIGTYKGLGYQINLQSLEKLAKKEKV